MKNKSEITPLKSWEEVLNGTKIQPDEFKQMPDMNEKEKYAVISKLKEYDVIWLKIKGNKLSLTPAFVDKIEDGNLTIATNDEMSILLGDTDKTEFNSQSSDLKKIYLDQTAEEAIEKKFQKEKYKKGDKFEFLDPKEKKEYGELTLLGYFHKLVFFQVSQKRNGYMGIETFEKTLKKLN